MKRVLVTGLNSYIGNSFASFCKDDFVIDKISLRDDSWQKLDFSIYDSILHVAGIAHTSRNANLESLYYKVNVELTTKIAKKAKQDGVGQFVFLSSIIVYGDNNSPVSTTKVIDENTKPNPDDFYGDSKLQAENSLKTLEGSEFKVAIVRPPMIYGEGSKGNYSKLAKLAKYSLIFPSIKNQRSVLHIDKLSEVLRDIVCRVQSGLFRPQDEDYFCTSKFIKDYRATLGKKTLLVSVFNPFIRIVSKKVVMLRKMFGSLIYKK
ncbi:NAD-dependent epimerase/dehydratase family protein [Francisella adeliensis]|uniref:NAD-dependent epimerase n=1 Tax=Francisella adeliensis TaxID=2007306 RepID=A0A2Z4XWX7_9GAMM|nr:NAD-dependent epimerase/dehydratase family protein [Francisella adeliensis]AXA33384.1 NAD-dependent epimerase [Francisella adeliensis]MBK2085399.1 NAD-dependent epimerase/dehydratase family protein [Francisella adeliensis]MBK2097129.1 NAD-dependent epimerase/dehydratase family protein [Francisella adeliensis]QIW11612.1 NAD-dependent epimerase/dehydratase family protein [Francisella adeliensis]QIW13487.1 NAD-dependent epimerase/dehydratase family protein [Francisella adeliensis]